MGTTLTIAQLDGVDQVVIPDVVVVPVARFHDELRLPLGLPSEVAGVSIPSSIDEAFAKREGFKAFAGDALVLSKSQGSPTLLAVGIGDPTVPDEEAWRKAAAAIVRSSRGARALLLSTLPSTVTEVRLGEALATGALLSSYRFDRKTSESAPGLEQLDVLPLADGGVSSQAADGLAAGLKAGRSIAAAVAKARDLINRHPSEVTPRRLAASLLRRIEAADKVQAEVWRESRIEDERLGALLGVSLGSKEAPRLMIATYDPRGFEEPKPEPERRHHKYSDPVEEPVAAEPEPEPHHVVLVGKGVTFDSGGLSLKTASGMTTMKTDMSGAAIVMAAMTVLADLDVKVKVTAIAPMSENMPGGGAMKPGDVLTARNGSTIEVLNTDAEGRLLLADALSLAVEMEPDAIIDVATLTGAAAVALGTSVAPILGNDDELVDAIISAGGAAGEQLWRLPLVAEYESHIDSDMADVKNVGSPGEAGTISAALFLQRFTGSIPWAHLDIAGTGRSDKAAGYTAKGGTAFSLRTLLTYLRRLD